MKFNEWMRLDEIQHVSFPDPISINGFILDSIDFRFEDWKRGFNPKVKRNNDSIVHVTSGKNFFSSSFSAPINPRKWININNEPNQTTRGNLAVATEVYSKIKISQIAEYTQLPSYWIDFAIFYMHNHVVKTPEWPRDRFETLPNSVAEI